MFYKWSKQYKRLKLKAEYENKKFAMKEIREQMALYAQANDEESKRMYQELLEKSMKDMDQRDKMKDKLEKPIEAAQEVYEKELSKIKTTVDDILAKENIIEEIKLESEKIKQQIEAKKQEKQEKELELQAIIEAQLEAHKEFTDDDIIAQSKLNGEVKKVESEILGLETQYNQIVGNIAVKQMSITEARKKAMDQIFKATAKYNHKMQILGEDRTLPTDVEYREKVFNTMKKITERTNKEKEAESAAKKEKEAEAAEAKRKQKEERKNNNNMNNKEEGQNKRENGTREPVPENNTQTSESVPTPVPTPKKGLFARIKDWWSRKKEKRLTDGKENKQKEVDENKLPEDVVFQETNYYDKEGKVVDGFYVSYYKEDKGFVPPAEVNEAEAQRIADEKQKEQEERELGSHVDIEI